MASGENPYLVPLLRLFLAASIAIPVAATGAPPAAAQAPEPYVDPPWAGDCEVHEFGEGEAPPAGSIDDDPLCVRYAKEDITVDDGGALDFLAGEPDRILAAIPACRYWQQDRWSVQVSDGSPAIVSWAGSYWFDRVDGQAAAILRDFQIAGNPAGADQVADLIEPLDAEWAETLRAYSGGPGGGAGGWMSFGGGDPSCAASPDDPTTDEAAGDPSDDPASRDGTLADPRAETASGALPATGGPSAVGFAVPLVAAALALRALPRPRRRIRRTP